jgi:hypothetical protein
VDARVEKWKHDLAEEERRQREAAQFHARPASVLERPPFVPQPSAHTHLIEVTNVELHSERRAREREAFERKKKEIEAMQEARKRQVTGHNSD